MKKELLALLCLSLVVAAPSCRHKKHKNKNGKATHQKKDVKKSAQQAKGAGKDAAKKGGY